MVNSRDEMKVADFGIARSLTDSVSMLTKSLHTSGTLLYMSPQQLDGERTSPLDDVYSVGAVLYELLTSKPPFYRGQIDHQIRTKPVAPIAERRSELGIEAPPVPPAWERTVAACLAKNPQDRPQSVQEIARSLSPESVETKKSPIAPTAASSVSAPLPADTFIGSVTATARRSVQHARSMDRKKLGYAVASVAIILLAILAAYYVRNSPVAPSSNAAVTKPSPSASPKEETGRVVVNTVPANASVYLDGSNRGKTPLVIDGVTPGIHHVSVEASGYTASSLIADVKGGGSFDFGTIHLVAMVAPSPSPTSTAVANYFTPPPSFSPSPSGPTRDLRAEIEKFVFEHLRKSVNADINGLLADYADHVDYYENGYVDHSFIVKDRQTYAAGWPVVKIVPLGVVRINDNGNSGRVSISFDYRFDARNNKGIHSLGDASNIWVLDTSYGGLKIVSEKQNVTNRKRTR
jgi:hypothetical protein